MKSIYVTTENKKYPVDVTTGFSQVCETARNCSLGGRKACIISDSNVAPIYMEIFKAALKDSFSDVYEYVFEAGEKSKNLDTIKCFYDVFLDSKLDRKSVVVGLGGGVCGDMAGFAAATFMRGIKFVQIPTSLLAQVDSSVGGKVAVDYRNNKNAVGAFYQPEFVYINTETLKTLPKREFSAGMAEVIKYGLMADRGFYGFIKDNKEKILNLENSVLTEMILKCCQIKADIVSKDEKENGLRGTLNFGHTIGHAIETVKNFQLLHGECVSIGMMAALNVSENRGYVSKNFVNEFAQLLECFGLPQSVDKVNAEDVYKQMFFDKKVKNNKINFVVMKNIGEVFITDEVSEKEILSAIESVVR